MHPQDIESSLSLTGQVCLKLPFVTLSPPSYTKRLVIYCKYEWLCPTYDWIHSKYDSFEYDLICPYMAGFVLCMTGFALNITKYVLSMTVLAADMTGFVLNMTGNVLNMTGFVLNITG